MTVYIELYDPTIAIHGFNTAKAARFESTVTMTGAVTLSGATTISGATTFSSTTAPAGANGRFYPIVAPNATPVAYTGDATLVAADLNKNVTNTGAAGTVTLTLPAVAGLAGSILHVGVTAAQIVRLDPAGSEAIFLDGSGVAGKYLNIAAVIGNAADIFCDGTQWLVVQRVGVVTKEA